MKEAARDIAVRAAKTFVQVFFAGLSADAFTGLDINAISTSGLAALAAVISVLMNAALVWANSE